MKLTESRLRNIIQEELSRLSEELGDVVPENREFVASVVQDAVDYLGLRLRRNTAGGRRSGEIEFADRDDDRGFFVRGEVNQQGRGFTLEIAGRGRDPGERGTMVRISNQGDKRDIEEVAEAIEEEPLDAFTEPGGRGQAPRRY
jgi:hypothetical protein